MNRQSHRIYFSSSPLTQRPRLELAPPASDWHEVRRWFWPLAFLLLVVSLYLLQSSFATTSELQIARLIKERDALVRHNIQLAAEIAELEKPSRIRERAYQLGLVDTGKFIKLNVQTYSHEPISVPSEGGATDNPSPWQQWLNEFDRWMKQAPKLSESAP